MSSEIPRISSDTKKNREIIRALEILDKTFMKRYAKYPKKINRRHIKQILDDLSSDIPISISGAIYLTNIEVEDKKTTISKQILKSCIEQFLVSLTDTVREEESITEEDIYQAKHHVSVVEEISEVLDKQPSYIDQIEDDKNSQENIIDIRVDDNLEEKKDLSVKKEDKSRSIDTILNIEPDKTWISSFLIENQEMLLAKYLSLKQYPNPMQLLFKYMIHELDSPIENAQINRFFKSVKNANSNSFKSFIELVENWSLTVEDLSLSFYLDKYIERYEKLYNLHTDSSTQSKISQIVKYLKGQKNKIVPERLKYPKYDKILQKIFDFYTKIQSLIGNTPSFTEIDHNNSVLTMPKFLKFTSDFLLTGHDSQSFSLIPITTAIDLFKKHAIYGKFLDFKGFKGILQSMSKLYHTAMLRSSPEKGSEEILIEFYKFLGLDDQSSLHQKMKDFRSHFSKEKLDFKAPTNHDTQEYKHKTSSKMKNNLDQLQKNKQTESKLRIEKTKYSENLGPLQNRKGYLSKYHHRKNFNSSSQYKTTKNRKRDFFSVQDIKSLEPDFFESKDFYDDLILEDKQYTTSKQF